jgi:beta-carotene ketolase (CrtW type)
MLTPGLLISILVYLLWITSLILSLFFTLPDIISFFMIPWLSFLYAGLFIQAHDGMHGSIVPNYPRLNHFLSAIFVWSYASFSYERLLVEHHKHHANSGHVDKDPDYHDGTHRGFLHWYAHFMLHYLSLKQLFWQSLLFFVLHNYFAIPAEKIILFWAIPSFLSTLQLFYFGTYRPHKDGTFLDHHRARSNNFPTWLSLLTCYHFGYHLEHHRNPGTPWWRLPELRRRGPIAD